MLEIVSLSHVFKQRGSEPQTALDAISITVPKSHLIGVIGATGSGKSTVIDLLMGKRRVQSGAILWNGRDIAQQPLAANAVGIVAGEDSLHPLMSVKEHLVCAQLLALGGVSKRDTLVRADQLLALCGLESVASARAEGLTRPQRRRLTLAVALAADPFLVVCDGFADDLDPKSERELAALLKTVAQQNPWRVVINATQSLTQASGFDSVVLLHEGRVCFHGPGRAITHYFSIPHIEDLYHKLAMRPVSRWQDSWNKHRDSYYAAFKFIGGKAAASEAELGSAGDDDGNERISFRAGSRTEDSEVVEEPAPAPLRRATLGTQVSTLISRRWTVFRRAKRALWWQVALMVAAPVLSLVMLWPQVRAGGDATRQGVFASGFFLLQSLWLVGMAVQTCAREIVDRRAMWAREHRAGLGVLPYLLGQLMFIGPLAIAQSMVVVLVPDIVTGGLPGNAPMRVVLMMLAAAAFSAVMLGISAWSRDGQQATSRGWLLAFLQAPVAGAVVALPTFLGAVLHPLATTYYAWSGSLDTLAGTASFEAITKVNDTWFAVPALAAIMLILHVAVGVALLVTGLRRAAQD